jgi:hypothetical protein
MNTAARTIRNTFVLSLLSILGLLGSSTPAPAVEIDFDTYAAVAFSPSTGKYGYAWNYRSRSAAEQVALSQCKAADAKIVGWVKGGWLALAIGEENAYGVAWEYGDGAANTDAVKRALQNLSKQNDKPAVLICLCSGDVPPRIVKAK